MTSVASGRFLDLHNNLFSGTLSCDVLAGLPGCQYACRYLASSRCVTSYMIAMTPLVGCVPHMASHHPYVSRYLDLSMNALNGNLSCINSVLPAITTLRIASNKVRVALLFFDLLSKQ